MLPFSRGFCHGGRTPPCYRLLAVAEAVAVAMAEAPAEADQSIHDHSMNEAQETQSEQSEK